MTRIEPLPVHDLSNGWSRILPRRDPQPGLAGDVDAEWLVIGAGFAGLAAARRLAGNAPGDRIVLVEAGECGENASGRNSGFAIDVPHTVSLDLAELQQANGYLRLARAGVRELSAQVAENRIDCGWSPVGKYHVAVTPAGAEAMLRPYSEALARLGVDHDRVDAETLGATLGTHHFHAALFTPGTVLMNPAALTRGLADTLPANVLLYENSPIIEFDPGETFRCRTPGGMIRARCVILAANGFSENFGVLGGRFFHLALHASMTRPLSDSEHASLGAPEPWGLTPANGYGGVTMRYTEDRRILFRQGIEWAPGRRPSAARQKRVARRHKALFDARFPGLGDVTFDHSWTGFVCMSRNGAPAFGRLARNLWVAACQNGIGVAKGTIGGILVADFATGRDNPLIDDMNNLGQPARMPPWPLDRLGVQARIRFEIWRNRKEA
ncbi:MAG: FAD-binding oxidoreductase [Paracoccaceae bacterium]|nr:FAD-binding oxidoreductase [Paracoccaceae bacterium]